jgi:hypothetical protein
LRKLSLSDPGNLSSTLFASDWQLPHLNTLQLLRDVTWEADQLHKWTEFGARVPNLKELSILRDGDAQWAQSKLWEENIPAGFPNLTTISISGYIVRPRSAVRMLAKYKTQDGVYKLERCNIRQLNWRLLGQQEMDTFTNLVDELATQPHNTVEWALSQGASFLRLNSPNN